VNAVVLGSKSYFEPFKHLGLAPKYLVRDESDLDDTKLVIFTGGEDIGPHLYGHKKHRSTYDSPGRDAYEVQVFKWARERNIPLAGICRGAQFLCAMAGGKLVQDVSNHCRWHKLMYRGEHGEVVESPDGVASTHHQMQYPWTIPEKDFELIAWAKGPLSDHYSFGNQEIDVANAPVELTCEPDVVYYKGIQALGFQYHPEFMESDSWGFRWAQETASKYIGPLLA
jgi:gamma-glutamyl-gamma-aminobutyrate hydrolase PuuD